jgi:hypothetical protein
MKLIIIPVDGAITKDGKVHLKLDLSSCNIPADVHALQWEEYEPNKGHIEFKSPLVQNQEITELPSWANVCLVKWEEVEATRLAAEQEAKLSAKPITTNN